jgi:signal transduction histidine kinase
MDLPRIIGEPQSLRRRLVVNILLALAFCIFFAAFILAYQFYEYLEDDRELSLTQETAEIAAEIRTDEPYLGFDPTALRFRGDGGLYRYTVFDDRLNLLVGTERIDGLYEDVAALKPGGIVFVDAGEMRTGAVRLAEHDDRRFIVVATTPIRPFWENAMSKFLNEVVKESQWVVLAAAAILAAALLATGRALAPVHRLSEDAREIQPGAPDRRLSTEDLPTEIRPLVDAVNEAFDRLDQGFRVQRDFSATVAHEIRTPLAVLRSTIDQMEDGERKQDLCREARRLGQLFEQLVDLSRAEALGMTAFTEVDLYQIAVAVGQEMGVQAVREGKKLSITGAETVMVRGHAGSLSIALRNLLANAVNYMEGPGEIEVEICDAPAGWRVLDRGPGIPDAEKPLLFQRFHRGAAGQREGAGIGLAIVKSVADAHGATVKVSDRRGGGSIFEFRFDQN